MPLRSGATISLARAQVVAVPDALQRREQVAPCAACHDVFGSAHPVGPDLEITESALMGEALETLTAIKDLGGRPARPDATLTARAGSRAAGSTWAAR